MLQSVAAAPRVVHLGFDSVTIAQTCRRGAKYSSLQSARSQILRVRPAGSLWRREQNAGDGPTSGCPFAALMGCKNPRNDSNEKITSAPHPCLWESSSGFMLFVGAPLYLLLVRLVLLVDRCYSGELTADTSREGQGLQERQSAGALAARYNAAGGTPKMTPMGRGKTSRANHQPR